MIYIIFHSFIFISSLKILEHGNEVFSKLSLFQAKPQLSQPVFVEVAHSSHHLCDPPLDWL